MIKLIIGLAGGTGSGKTYTSLILAKGIAGGQRFCVIDTENGRASMYADDFDFDVLEIQAPFTPQKYFDAIQAAENAGYAVIVVDQFSHEWEGDGGIMDEHDKLVDEMVKRSQSKGDTRPDYVIAESHNMRAWAESKAPHKRMMTHLTQMKCHLILNFRAEDKIEMTKEKDEQTQKTKTVIRPKVSATGTEGWIPICERRMPFELTTSVLFKAENPGVPIPIKLMERHKPFFPGNRKLIEADGAAFAAWARGGSVPMLTADDILDIETLRRDKGMSESEFNAQLAKGGFTNLQSVPKDKGAAILAWLNRRSKK
jgi:hypothetical protein